MHHNKTVGVALMIMESCRFSNISGYKTKEVHWFV